MKVKGLFQKSIGMLMVFACVAVGAVAVNIDGVFRITLPSYAAEKEYRWTYGDLSKIFDMGYFPEKGQEGYASRIVMEKILASNPELVAKAQARNKMVRLRFSTKALPREHLGAYLNNKNGIVMRPTGAWTATYSESNIYSNAMSRSTYTIAHELGHWQNDVEGRSTRNAKKEERNADLNAIRLLDNVPELSSQITAPRAAEGDKRYMTNEEFLHEKSLLLKENSNGRVRFYNVPTSSGNRNLMLSLDGYDFVVARPAENEKTVYLGGQIAWCIKHGYWKRGHFVWSTQNKIFEGGDPNKVVAYIKKNPLEEYAKYSNVAKILATFDLSPEEARKPVTTKTLAVMNTDKAHYLSEKEYFDLLWKLFQVTAE